MKKNVSDSNRKHLVRSVSLIYLVMLSAGSTSTMVGCAGGDGDGDGDGDGAGGSESGGTGGSDPGVGGTATGGNTTGGSTGTGGDGLGGTPTAEEFEIAWEENSVGCFNNAARTAGVYAGQAFVSGRTIVDATSETTGETTQFHAFDAPFDFVMDIYHPASAQPGQVVAVTGVITGELDQFNELGSEETCFGGHMLVSSPDPAGEEPGVYHRVLAEGFGYPDGSGGCNFTVGDRISICTDTEL